MTTLFPRFLARYAPELLTPSWAAWRACVAAILGLPVTADEAAIIKACTDREPPTTAAREAWLIIGRRGGKSRTAAVLAAFLATCRDYRAVLAPGERGVVMLIAADRRQARVLKRYIDAVFTDNPELDAMVESRTADAINLTNQITIEIHTCSFRTTRGYTIVAALLDEAAFWHTDEAGASPDVEVVNAIRPAMATIPGAVLLGLSSPYRRAGVLWTAYHTYFGKPGDVLVWQASTQRMNPRVPLHIIEQAYREDEAAASAEYGAEFRRDLEKYISRDVVEALVVPERRQREAQAGAQYRAFCDPSGGSVDSMTLAIASKDTRHVAVLDVLLERRAPFNPEDVVLEFARVLKSYGIHDVSGDRYGGEWPRARFSARGVSYHVADKTKSELYGELLPLLMGSRVELLDDPRLVHQLVSLERKTSRQGKDVIDHPPRGHDDLSNAAAGALVAATAHSRCPIGVARLPEWM